MKTPTGFLLITIIIGFYSCENDNTQINKETYLDFLSDKAITSIRVYDQTIWIASTKICDTCYVAPHWSFMPTIEQLTMIKGSNFEYVEPSAFGTPRVDSKGNLYVASNNTLYQLIDIKNYSVVIETGDFNFNSFTFDNDDNVWFSGYNGIAFWNKTDLRIYNSNNSELPTDIIHGLVIDNSGIVWVALNFQGLLKIEFDNWEIIPNSEITGLKDNSILYNPIIDNENNIWFSIICPDINSNILLFNGSDWTYQNDCYGNLTKDSKGAIWAINSSYDSGNFISSTVSYYMDSEWFEFDVSDIDSKILTLNLDNYKVYIGTSNGLVEKSK